MFEKKFDTHIADRENIPGKVAGVELNVHSNNDIMTDTNTPYAAVDERRVQSGAVRHGVAAEKRAYCVNDIADILDISRSSAYALVRQGHFKTVRIGTAIRISRASFDKWLDTQD